MKRSFLFATGVLFLFSAILFFSCKKIFEPTDIGLEMIPEVDNIHTFDTTLEVFAYNNIFDINKDSTRSNLAFIQILGDINNDPIFGKTHAEMFFDVAPGTRTPFANAPNKLTLDSVVLVLNYYQTYGDTAKPINIQVSELAQSNNFIPDSSYMIKLNPFVSTTLLGSKSVIPYRLKDSIKLPYEHIKGEVDTATARQLRIKLNDSFGNRLLSYDTSGVNNAYQSDSVFRTFFKGFALKSTGSANALLGFNLTGNSKLAVYYKYENKTTAGDIDTAVTYFAFNTLSSPTANYIVRDYGGTQVLATSGDNIADNLVYIQGTPGTYATLKIPGLKGFKNSIVHLAELSMESVYDNQDTLFFAPGALFLDAYDSATSKYMTIPHSMALNPRVTNTFPQTINGYDIVNYGPFGSYYKNANDLAGNPIKKWRFNLTRYVQSVAKQTTTPKDLRLYAPHYNTIANGDDPNATLPVVVEPMYALINRYVLGMGRVRLGGGQHPTQKMKLRIVYSKI